MADYYFCTESGKALDPPIGKHLDIFKAVMAPNEGVKQIDVCCGRGFGKTLLAIEIAAIVMESDPDACGLFLEPDWDRVHRVFLIEWVKWVPSDLYKLKVGEDCIYWHNGARLYYKPRVITGSKELSRHKGRGINPSFVIDDETAIGFDREQFDNLFASLRGDAKLRFYLTLSTPLVGPYGRFLNRGGNIFFRGRSDENVALLKRDPTYVDRQRSNMGIEQARRELDGELVALEGRIWKYCKYLKYDEDNPDNKNYAWPKGNRNDTWTGFQKNEPWYLLCDIGSATGAYAVMQAMPAIHNGLRIMSGDVWTAIADYCPNDDANASRAFQRLKKEFGDPVAVVAGSDLGTGVNTDGSTVSYHASKIFGPTVQIYPCKETKPHKQYQYDCLSKLMCSATGQRRFTIARDFVSIDPDSRRGIVEMIDEDAFPPIDKRRADELLPKNKENLVQHIRDALLMGTEQIMEPPNWLYDDDPAA